MLGFSGIFDVLLLIALGIGYLVIYFAKREEKELRFFGIVIGGVIIVLSLVYFLGNVWFQAKVFCPKMHYYKGMMQQRMMHPRMMPQAPAQKP